MARVCSASVAFAVLFIAGSLNVAAGSWEEVSSEEAAMTSSSGSPPVVTADVGGTAYLFCNVSSTSDSVVTWVRDKDMTVLTVGRLLMTRDMRFSLRPEFPSNGHMLQIDSVKPKDSGDYVCIDSSRPTNRHVVHLSVIEPRIKIVGERTRSVVEGASVKLTCVVEPIPTSLVFIEWTRETEDKIFNLPNDTAIITEIGDSFRSTLWFINIRLSDAGNYTCTPSEGNSATITVHVTHGQFGAGMNKTDLSTSNVAFSKVVSSSAPEMTTEVSRTSGEKRKLGEFETERTRGLTLTEVQRLVMLRKLKVLALQEDVSKLQIQVLRLEKAKLLQTEN